MLFSLLFFAVLLVNCWLIFYFLLAPLTKATADLGKSLRHCRRYLVCRLTENRETAMRGRCLKTIGQALRLLLVGCAILLAYSPALLLAAYQSELSRAIWSSEALAAMTAAVAATALARRRK